MHLLEKNIAFFIYKRNTYFSNTNGTFFISKRNTFCTKKNTIHFYF